MANSPPAVPLSLFCAGESRSCNRISGRKIFLETENLLTTEYRDYAAFRSSCFLKLSSAGLNLFAQATRLPRRSRIFSLVFGSVSFPLGKGNHKLRLI